MGWRTFGLNDAVFEHCGDGREEGEREESEGAGRIAEASWRFFSWLSVFHVGH